MESFLTAVIQMDCEVRNPNHNIRKALSFAEEAAGRGAKILIFPELFISGYGINADYQLFSSRVTEEDPYLNPFYTFSKDHDVMMIGGFCEQAEEGVYDSHFVIDQGILLGVYRKQFLWGEEVDYFQIDKTPLVINTRFGTIGNGICYEAGFPEHARQSAQLGAQIYIVTSAFGKARLYAWELMMRSRALENGIYVLASNRTGLDEGKYEFAGNSRIVNPRGQVQSTLYEEEGIAYARVELSMVGQQRKTIPYLKTLEKVGM